MQKFPNRRSAPDTEKSNMRPCGKTDVEKAENLEKSQNPKEKKVTRANAIDTFMYSEENGKMRTSIKSSTSQHLVWSRELRATRAYVMLRGKNRRGGFDRCVVSANQPRAPFEATKRIALVESLYHRRRGPEAEDRCAEEPAPSFSSCSRHFISMAVISSSQTPIW